MGIDSKLPDLQISEVDIIDVDVDDQAKTTTLGALSPEKAASALAKLEGKDANGTQEIDFGDVLEVSSKLEGAPASEKPAPVSTRSAPKSAPPRPSSRPVKTAPPSGLDSAHNFPSCASTIEREMERPMPMPPALLVAKGSNRFS